MQTRKTPRKMFKSADYLPQLGTVGSMVTLTTSPGFGLILANLPLTRFLQYFSSVRAKAGGVGAGDYGMMKR